ncbi:hypothetical protein GCM10023352_04670 [Rothia endophytica]|uniref:Uncharacterized protein n=1 Tax=Rothia endophytica TaxID=1324766 RepID=A0ABP9B395_9MICC
MRRFTGVGADREGGGKLVGSGANRLMSVSEPGERAWLAAALSFSEVLVPVKSHIQVLDT